MKTVPVPALVPLSPEEKLERRREKDRAAKRRARARDATRINARELEAKRKYREANREAAREACRRSKAANPQPDRDSKARRRARKAEVVEPVKRAVVFDRDKGICGICGKPVDPLEWHMDHIKPLSRGGEHTYENVQVSHPLCNWEKGAPTEPAVCPPVVGRKEAAAILGVKPGNMARDVPELVPLQDRKIKGFDVCATPLYPRAEVEAVAGTRAKASRARG